MKNSTATGEVQTTKAKDSSQRFVTIPQSACTPAQVTYRNWATTGNWYIQTGSKVLNRGTGTAITDYAFKLQPGEEATEENPPIGEQYCMCDAGTDGPMSYYASWRDR